MWSVAARPTHKVKGQRLVLGRVNDGCEAWICMSIQLHSFLVTVATELANICVACTFIAINHLHTCNKKLLCSLLLSLFKMFLNIFYFLVQM